MIWSKVIFLVDDPFFHIFSLVSTTFQLDDYDNTTTLTNDHNHGPRRLIGEFKIVICKVFSHSCHLYTIPHICISDPTISPPRPLFTSALLLYSQPSLFIKVPRQALGLLADPWLAYKWSTNTNQNSQISFSFEKLTFNNVAYGFWMVTF